MKNRTTVEQTSERELVITRTFNGPARLVFEAWTKPELFKRWWVPKSIGMTVSLRDGRAHRRRVPLAFGQPCLEADGVLRQVLEVTPNARLVWTNDESGDGGAVTTVTFEERAARHCWSCSDLYPSKEALAAGHGAEEAMPEMFDQLDELLRR